MRTTVTLDQDVAAAVEKLRRERSIGLSEAVNELVRAGLITPRQRRPFVQKSREMGQLLDVSNVAEVLETLEGPDYR